MLHLYGSHAAPQHSAPHPYSVRHHTTHDAGEQAAYLHGWSQQYEQLTPGIFEGQVDEICISGSQLFAEKSNQTLQESCCIEENTLVIGVPVRLDNYGWCDGWQVDLNTLLLHKPGSELLFRTPGQLELLAVSVSQSDLLEHARRVEQQEIAPHLERVLSPRRNPQTARQLRDFLGAVMASLNASPAMLAHAPLRKGLKEGILGTVISIIGNPESVDPGPRTSVGRQQVVARAIEYMRTRIDEPISVSDLCTALQVSRRTLQYCFEEVLQINPVSYLKALRLNGVRKELRSSDPLRTAIQDVAARWGFWHLSRFAQEYRQMFGELPSETLKGFIGHHRTPAH
ncbi:MAG: helix-turn-helix domain-containing protein [Rhodocyclales bacterium]|nr:helix-turn-helix domain-containing protein [Rhodocyclales bacterium]